MTAPSRQAVEAALEAWYTTPTDYVFETKPEADARQMLAAITAALPHLFAAKDAELTAACAPGHSVARSREGYSRSPKERGYLDGPMRENCRQPVLTLDVVSATLTAAKDAEIAALTRERDFFHKDRNRLADENHTNRLAMEKAGQLISYAGQDAVSPVIAEANRNQAWHVLVAALNTPSRAALEMSGGVK